MVLHVVFKETKQSSIHSEQLETPKFVLLGVLKMAHIRHALFTPEKPLKHCLSVCQLYETEPNKVEIVLFSWDLTFIQLM